MSTRNGMTGSGRMVAASVVALIAVPAALAGPTDSHWRDHTGYGQTTLLGENGSRLSHDEIGAALTGLRSQLSRGGGMGGLTDDPLIPAVHPGSVASLSLRMLGLGGASGFVNSLGEVNVLVNSGFQNMGVNPAGRQIVGQFRQFFTPDNRDFIEIEYKTIDGSPLVPVGTMVSGQVAIAYGWEVGATNPIDWHEFWERVDVPENGAIATFFGPGGNSSVNHTPELVGPLGGPWNGVDTDNLLIALGDLFDRVLIRYQVNPIPAPSALLAVGAGLGLAFRRRR